MDIDDTDADSRENASETAHSAATSFVGFLSLGAALRLPRPTTSSFPLCQRAITMPHTSPT